MATAMHAAEERLDVAASNLANVSTEGFRGRLTHVRLTAGGLVATNEVDVRGGPLQHTGRAFDLAVAGPGAFLVRDRDGRTIALRSGSFEPDRFGRLADVRGNVVLGRHGPVVCSASATIDSRDIVRFDGAAVDVVRTTPATQLQSGFLEAANVNAVGEMVEVLQAQRAFETAQKTLGAIDDARQKDVDDVARVKS